MVNELRIFLSSTFIDLEAVRSSILKFLQVLHSDVISMEIFGSDESKPKDFCLDQVRRCNLFIGIYAERYGSIDEETDLSITELEYKEAYNMMESNRLLGLLVYIVDPEAHWPLNLIERDPKRSEKLKALKDELTRKHTVTFFKSTEELPFLILRDVIRKVSIGTKQVFQPRTRLRQLVKSNLDRPVGMEFYTEDLIALFQGREEESNKLVDLFIKNKMTLLIGASGIGKTSLLNAGVFPLLHRIGWETALIRPLTEPIENMRNMLWNQLLSGALPKQFDFRSVVRSVATAHNLKHVLIVIDQFEDILGVKASIEREALTRALLDLYVSGESNLRFLVCYRGDVESQLGPIWQTVSGSTDGLPRLYLGPLSKEGGMQSLAVNLNALGIRLRDEQGEQTIPVINRITEDLITESHLSGYSGIYPPFLQMVISRIVSDADKKGNYTEKLYDSAGRARRIIADYLISQLRYLGKDEPIGRQILIALVSSYGRKSQKTIKEIAHEILQGESVIERILTSLIDLRMVRLINNQYEIVHDFLAKTILVELVSTEEREAKKFKDLLASRAAAYADTKALLTRPEHFHIYKYRNQILCTEGEAQLLLAGHLAGNGPVYFWLKAYSREQVIIWVQHFLSEVQSQLDENKWDEGLVSFLLNIYRFLIKAGVQIPLQEAAKYFSKRYLKSELASFIPKIATHSDVKLLMKLYLSQDQDVSQASEEALLRFISLNDEELLNRISKSSKLHPLFESFSFRFAHDLSLKDIRSMYVAKETWKRFFSIYALGEYGTIEDLELLSNLLESWKRGIHLRTALVRSITRLSSRLRKTEAVRSFLKSDDNFLISTCLEALEYPIPKLKLEEVLTNYDKFPEATAGAVRALASKKDLPLLKKTLESIDLYYPASDIVLAICDNGGEKEFEFLAQLFSKYKDEVNLGKPPLILKAVARLAGAKHLPELKSLINSDAFWKRDYEIVNAEQSSNAPSEYYPYFIKWLLGVAYAHLAKRRHLNDLRLLLTHPFWTVRNAAADAIIRIGKVSDLPQLIEDALSFKGNQDAIIKTLNGLDERFYSSFNSDQD